MRNGVVGLRPPGAARPRPGRGPRPSSARSQERIEPARPTVTELTSTGGSLHGTRRTARDGGLVGTDVPDAGDRRTRFVGLRRSRRDENRWARCSPCRNRAAAGRATVGSPAHGYTRSTSSSPQGGRRLVRTVHRPGPPGRRPGPGGSSPPQPQLHRHRAHPARADPRGRGRRRQGPRVARHLARGRAQPGRGDHRPGRLVAVAATSPSRPGPRRSSSCRCARRCSSATTTSAPSTSSSASSARARASPPRCS